jgi:uncharacterized protein with ParB-like and HNH nuclease domain
MEFTPEQKALTDLFGNNITYIIPEYQRPYSWDCIGKSDKNNQVNVIWQDLIDFYESKNPNIYFMGSMVVIGDSITRTYQVVDGQQRLTTLTILLTAIKCFLSEIYVNKNIPNSNQNDFLDFIKGSSDNVDKLIFNEKRIGLYTRPEKKVKIERTIGFDYDNVLKVVMECGDSSSINLNEASEEQKEITKRYFNNRKYFVEQLKDKFLENGIHTNEKAEELSAFFEFLTEKVTIVQIRTSNFEVAYQIFEILNNRGLPLSNKDLFRNFLISQFHTLKLAHPIKYKDLDPSEKWRAIDTNYELDSEFISRYVESKSSKNQKYSAFNDIQVIYNKDFKDTIQASKIDSFYKDIEINLALYTKILNFEFVNKQLRNSISFLLKSGNLSYTLNLLLALLRKEKDEDKVLLFLKSFEKYIIYTILGPSKRFSTKPIYQAINFINNSKIKEAQNVFELNKIELDELKNSFDTQIKDNDIAKLIILKYYFVLDNINPDDVVEQNLDFSRSTLEHIIPQNPDKSTNWLTDFDSSFRTEYTYKLGNMTLLTQKMNSKARNFDFSKKKPIYGQAKLSMTTEISHLSKIDSSFFKTRHRNIIDAILNDLNLK